MDNKDKILGTVEIQTPKATHEVRFQRELEVVSLISIMDKCMDDFMDLSEQPFLSFYCCLLDIWSEAHQKDLLEMVDTIHALVHAKVAEDMDDAEA